MHNAIVADALRRRLAEIGSSLEAWPSENAHSAVYRDLASATVAEEALRRLMVNDRARTERGETVDLEGVFARLELVAVYANHTDDLRFLDALNYYFELSGAFPARLLKRYETALSAHVVRLCE
jgi:hypothetical protein